jgi:hypothetical protein
VDGLEYRPAGVISMGANLAARLQRPTSRPDSIIRVPMIFHAPFEGAAKENHSGQCFESMLVFGGQELRKLDPGRAM